MEIKKDADCIENAFVHDRTVSFNVSTFSERFHATIKHMKWK